MKIALIKFSLFAQKICLSTKFISAMYAPIGDKAIGAMDNRIFIYIVYTYYTKIFFYYQLTVSNRRKVYRGLIK